ncbi:hypothetical protein MTO96_044976 [Rhipicephalus appendiculatus]
MLRLRHPEALLEFCDGCCDSRVKKPPVQARCDEFSNDVVTGKHDRVFDAFVVHDVPMSCLTSHHSILLGKKGAPFPNSLRLVEISSCLEADRSASGN